MQSTPDSASRMYIERAIDIAVRYRQLFDDDQVEAFVVTGDFVSSGRISGAKSPPERPNSAPKSSTLVRRTRPGT